MRYRMLKCGDVIAPDDEYQTMRATLAGVDVWTSVEEVSVGQRLLDCNVGYYRRPIRDNSDHSQMELL